MRADGADLGDSPFGWVSAPDEVRGEDRACPPLPSQTVDDDRTIVPAPGVDKRQRRGELLRRRRSEIEDGQVKVQ